MNLWSPQLEAPLEKLEISLYIYIYLELPAAEISAATHCGGNSRRIPENQPHKKSKTPQPKQKRRNTVCFPPISAAFPPISAAFPPISAANRGVEKTENKFCRNSKKKDAANLEEMPQIQKGVVFFAAEISAATNL